MKLIKVWNEFVPNIRIFHKNQVKSGRTAHHWQLWAQGHRLSRWSRPQEQDDFICNTDMISFLVPWLRLRAETLRETEVIHQIGRLFTISIPKDV